MYLQQSYEWEILVHQWNTVVSEVFSCFHADSGKVKRENCLEIEKCNYSQYKLQKKNLLKYNEPNNSVSAILNKINVLHKYLSSKHQK